MDYRKLLRKNIIFMWNKYQKNSLILARAHRGSVGVWPHPRWCPRPSPGPSSCSGLSPAGSPRSRWWCGCPAGMFAARNNNSPLSHGNAATQHWQEQRWNFRYSLSPVSYRGCHAEIPNNQNSIKLDISLIFYMVSQLLPKISIPNGIRSLFPRQQYGRS